MPPELDDAELERRLFAPPGVTNSPPRPLPDWAHVHAELRRRGVTLLLLWEEYRAEHADGYGYSGFCDLYVDWRRGVSATMRQTHVAGERLFVDYAGDTVPVFDGASGEERRAHVFVAVMGASNYTYAEARWSEGLADWIGCHVNALAFLGGVPRLLVCDNLRAGVTAACRYEPGINRTYADLAAHSFHAIASVRSTQDATIDQNRLAHDVVRGTIVGTGTSRLFDPGTVPVTCPPDSFWSGKHFRLPAFEPPRGEAIGAGGIPSLGLDALLVSLLGDKL